MAAYADLGKNAKKILTEGFNGQKVKLSANHGFPGNCTVTTSTVLDTKTTENAIAIDLATKLVSQDRGVTVVDKRGINKDWVGSHSLTATLTNFCDVKNLTFTVDSTGKINLAYKNNFLNESISYVPETETFEPTVCLSQNNFAAGIQTTIQLLAGSEHGPKATSIAAGYLGKKIQAHVHADKDLSKIGATLWGTMGGFEGAVAASQVRATSDIFGELGARYNVAPDFFVGAKIDTNTNFGLCSKKTFDDNLAISASISTPMDDISNVQLGGGLDFSHNFELLESLRAMGGSNKSSNNDNANKNNSARKTRRVSLTANNYRKQRAGATSKELGDNCTSDKCRPIKRHWEEETRTREEQWDQE